MTREEVYRDMENEIGLVPSFYKKVPDSVLEHDWATCKALLFSEGVLGLKTKHLIGLGVSGAIKCRYCTVFHLESAKMAGATDDEINEALRFAMDVTGWSTFINGLDIDIDEFKNELSRMKDFLLKKQEKVEIVRASV